MRESFDAWCAVAADPGALAAAPAVADFGAALEAAFDSVRDDWWSLGRAMGRDPSAMLAHTPSCAANVSDFGLMLAWERLVDGWASGRTRVLVVCDDPWLFRHLAARDGVVADAPPGLVLRSLLLRVRGTAARAKVAISALGASLAFRRRAVPAGMPWLLVYGHPGSTVDGDDAYFGGLMQRIVGLRRALHVDAGFASVRRLESSRTFGLHAWGSPAAALKLMLARWRPRRELLKGPRGWLIRRAAAREGATGQPAMIAWQIACQERWLAVARPAAVAWPWENHAWERALVRAARRLGVRTVGYQHATVGGCEWNYAPASNPDGAESLPDTILCAGELSRRLLAAWGHAETRLAVAGALRFARAATPATDPGAPVFVALPFDGAVAAEIVAAIRPLAEEGRRFRVKDHPLSPFRFEETANVARSAASLAEQPAVSAVIYAMTTVGLESALAGLPTLRFVPAKSVPVDVVPRETDVPAADARCLGAALATLRPPRSVRRDDVFAPVDMTVWSAALSVRADADATPAPSQGYFIRRLGHLARDPVLRRWLVERLFGRTRAVPLAAARPPYLDGIGAAGAAISPETFGVLDSAPPSRPFRIDLHGRRFDLEPGRPVDLFTAPRSDLETALGLHRFAWLNAADDADEAWFTVLWSAWCRDFAKPDGGWPWHPYTVAERAINILDFAARRGLPGPREATLEVLALHARVIRERLEYFGERNTGNHLANNGRGLYRIGLALGLCDAADAGARILIEEATRIFMPSGVLREGSSHYHALVAGWYQDCLAAARRHGRPEAADLAAVAERALAVMPRLTLPGGFPLIGDVSPDRRPAATLATLPPSASPIPEEFLARDGWLHAGFGPWAGLWHAAPGGWSPMPGHGHQDVGAPEIHFGTDPLFVDPGRGAYGESGAAAFYRSGAAHNGLTVDGADPYPPNRPYYEDTFRRRIGGPPPTQDRFGDGVRVRHNGFARLPGVGAVTRTWRFDARSMVLADHVEGRGRRRIVRRMNTPHPVTRDGDALVIKSPAARFRVTADVQGQIEPVVRWIAYGEGTPAVALEFHADAALPWRGEISIEVV